MKSLLLSFTGMKLGVASWLPECFLLFCFFSLSIFCVHGVETEDDGGIRSKQAVARGPYLSSCGRIKFCLSVKIEAQYLLTAAHLAFNYTVATSCCIGYRGGWKDWVKEVHLKKDAHKTAVVDKMKDLKRNKTKQNEPNLSLIFCRGAMWLLVALTQTMWRKNKHQNTLCGKVANLAFHR